MYLNYQLAQNVDGNIVTASVFLENSTDIYSGGGYDPSISESYYGFNDENERNYNAHFTFSFDKITMTGIFNSIEYSDCTAGGMMGSTCMTGHNLPKMGSMGAYPLSLTISAVASACRCLPVL
jgi:hypothetical protein